MTPTFRAPGRVNLIGDHTDYNEGFVLPVAIDLECVLTTHDGDPGCVRVRSLDADGDALVEVAADGSDEPRDVVPGWGRYVAGVVRALAERGRAPVGMSASVSSTVPIGAGLSSSAALEVSVALALAEAAGLVLAPLELARACQKAELVATGVPCGIMDQLASVAGRSGHALLIDCRSLAVDYVPIPRKLAIVVVHSAVPRSLDATPYVERRAECEAAAARLDLRTLREATLGQVANDPRARHVVSENQRVLAAADALRRGDLDDLGELLSESHASLRDDFGVSTHELDVLVAALERAGAPGARLTGAGFGGCVVAVADRSAADGIIARATGLYRSETGLEPTAYLCSAAAGAGRQGP